MRVAVAAVAVKCKLFELLAVNFVWDPFSNQNQSWRIRKGLVLPSFMHLTSERMALV